MLILGAILIALGALLAVVALFMTVTRSESGVEHLGSGQALFLAESGREQAYRALTIDNTFCSQINFSNVSLGNGTFTATAVSYKAATRLSSAIGVTDTVLPVLSTAGFASHGRVLIDLEAVDYTGLGSTSAACTPATEPCLTGVVRGVQGTAAVSHAVNISVGQEQCVINSTGSVGRTGSNRTVQSAHWITPAMMVYTKTTAANASNIPFFRLWDGTSWGLERQANALAHTISFLTVKMARTRNEAIVVTQTRDGSIDAQVWNGASWSTPQNMGTITTAAHRTRKGFDVSYETAKDRALVVYNKSVNDEFSFQIWTGVGWVSESNQTFPDTTLNNPLWLRLAPNPRPESNDIAMITLTSASSVYGMLWTGANWSNMGMTSRWSDIASTTTRQAIDVAYESISGRALFVWGVTTNNTAGWFLWTGTNLSGSSVNVASTVASGFLSGDIEWTQLARDHYSNRIVFGAQSDDPDIVAWRWEGDTSSFNAGIRIEATPEIRNSRNFDLVFDTAPNASHRARIVFGDGATASVNRGYDDAGTWNWQPEASDDLISGTDDTVHVQMAAHPRSGTILAVLYERLAQTAAQGELRETHLTDGVADNSGWSAANTSVVWDGPMANNAQGFLVDIAVSPYLPRIDWIEIFQ